MKIGILCAVDRELEPFLAHIQNGKTSEKAMLTFYEGQIYDMDVVAVRFGVCKTNAAIAAQIAIDTYGADLIINAGTAGGMDETVELLETVIGTEIAHHDVHEQILTGHHPWMPSAYFKPDEALLALSQKAATQLDPSHKLRYGRMVTGESFIDEAGRAEINAQFAPLTVDMETAGAAQVCYVNEIPFIAIRTVTDTAKHSGQDNFEKNCAVAAALSKDMTLALLKEIKREGMYK